jgi:hypothetical protein
MKASTVYGRGAVVSQANLEDPPVFTPDAFITELYVLVDDWDKTQPTVGPVPGPRPALSPSETITLAMLAQFGRFSSERDFWRYATCSLRSYFPQLPNRSQFNRAVRHVGDRITAFALAVVPLTIDAQCSYEIIDGTGVVTRNLKRRGRGWLAGEAAIGQCTRLGWYEGVRLLLATTPHGAISGWGIGPANTNDRRLAETLLAVRAAVLPALSSAGTPIAHTYLADKGFAGMQWEAHWHDDFGATVIAPPETSHRRAWSAPWRRWLASKRQIIETTTDRLLAAYGLAHERPHTLTGLHARLAARIALHNVCFLFNCQTHRPPLSFAGFIAW